MKKLNGSKIESFDMLLTLINTVINIGLVIFAVICLFAVFKGHLSMFQLFIACIISVVIFVTKTLAFGMAFCSIETAKNTRLTLEAIREAKS